MERAGLRVVWGALLLALVALAATPAAAPPAPPQQQAAPGQEPMGAGKGGELVKLPLPAPEVFKTKEGKTGWKLKIPGERPLATPAIVDGVVYVGGGFGSHEFYALDAKTGKPVWTCKTADDGPTAAAVVEGCVAYNTESCTLIVHDTKTGKVLWHKWLGDPLMSQPAAANGRLFMAYPGKDGSHHLVAFKLRTGDVLWDQKIAADVISAPVIEGACVYAATVDGTLYCFEAATGKLLWKESRNVTSAPRILAGKVYVSQRVTRKVEVADEKGGKAKKEPGETTFEGFNVADAKAGKFASAEPQAAIRAPYLLSMDRAEKEVGTYTIVYRNGALVMRHAMGAAPKLRAPVGAVPAEDAEKLDKLAERMERLKKKDVAADPDGALKDAEEALAIAGDIGSVEKSIAKSAEPEAKQRREDLRKTADELRTAAEKVRDAAFAAKQTKQMAKAIQAEMKVAAKQDAAVGFAEAPAAANLPEAIGNIGQGNVKAVWAFQGSRPQLVGSRCIAVSGDQFRSVDASTGKVAWEAKIESKVDATRPATPPALAGGKFYLGTADGRILCVDPETGKTLWEAQVGGRILFEPAVVDGRVYVATEDGTLICLETGDRAADGWPMWGGSAKHNGPETK